MIGIPMQTATNNSLLFLNWQQAPWFKEQTLDTDILRSCDQIFQNCVNITNLEQRTSKLLGDILALAGAQWGGILFRNGLVWETLTETGHRPIHLPFDACTEVLDRDASCFYQEAKTTPWKYLVSPLPGEITPNQVFILAGRNLSQADLPMMVAVSRSLVISLKLSEREHITRKRLERMEKTLDIISCLTEQTSTAQLLRIIAEQASLLLGCERTSIFLWNKSNKELVAQLAMGMEDQELRIPDDKGIVGNVVQTGQSITVDDVYSDPRFEKAVDKKSGFQTRNILCVPLRDRKAKIIGAFEAMNKKSGIFSEADDHDLQNLGVHAAIALQNTNERENLIQTAKHFTEEANKSFSLIGESSNVNNLKKQIPLLAKTELPVMVLGESGTGKEVVSRALHFAGPRAEKPFIAVNCAAISESLLESELFGHEKGAFTDARDLRQGKFELADGGTLFLDEIGDLSPGGQAKLLRVLENKVITRVGGSKDIHVNVRILAATNVNLAEAVYHKKFREDLFFRLNVVTLNLLPLRERPEDVIPLAEHFLLVYCQQAGKPLLKLSPEARKRVQAHNWPGNVRELRNLMERIAYLAPGPRVEGDDVAFILSPQKQDEFDPMLDEGLAEATHQFQRTFIRKAISRVKDNMTDASELLGLHRANLYRKMKQLDMKEAGGEL
jgi:Nif-specific regulatory protein